MPQSKIEPREVLQYLRDEDLPLLTSRMVAETFDVSDQTARNKLSALVDEGQLTKVDLGARQSVWLEPDYESASEVADALRESFDLAELNGDHLVDFAEDPYCILPKEDNEAYVVVPRFVPFHVGWLDRQTDAYNVFVVNKYVDWIDEVPEEIREQVGIGGEWDNPVVADGELHIDPGERGAAWEQFSTDRHQDAIPPDDVLEEMDWDRLQGLASRRGVLGQGMTREDVERALADERDDGRIPLKDSREFDVIAQLVEDGNLPFEPQPIDESRLRTEPADIDLRDYQRRAWNQYVDTGMVGIYWPPGAGKTFISLYAGERLPGEKLVVVPNNTLKEQWQNRIADMCAHTDEWRVETYQYLTHGDNIREFEDNGPALTIFDECLSGDTEVVTPNGRISFNELDKEYDLEGGWTRDIDLSVETFDPDSNRHEWDTVTGVHKTEAQIRQIRTATGRELKATSGHTHLVFDPETGEIAEQTDVSEGDFLLLPLPSHDTGVESDYPEEELLGWFIGDGHATEYGNVKFSFAQHAEEQIAIITDLLDRLGYPYSTFENSRGDLSVYAPKLACQVEWAVDTGAKANDVRIPSEAFIWDSNRVAALLRGLFDAEGSVSDDGRIQFNSTSKRLTDDVGWLLQRLGVLTNRQEIDRSNRTDASDIHRLNIPSTYGKRFEETIGFCLDHKVVRVTDSDTNPDTAVPVSTPLRELKEALNARNRELAEWAGVSEQTIGGVLRGEHRLGKRYLQELAASLRQYATRPMSAEDREEYNIPYSEVSDEMGSSLSHAYTMLTDGGEAATSALETLLRDRQETALEYACLFEQLSGLHVVEVIDVEDREIEPVYDLETESHTFVADGVFTHNCHHLPANTFATLSTIDTETRIGLSASPYREDGRTEYIFALTGYPVGLEWQELVALGAVDTPDADLYIYSTERQKVADVQAIVDEYPGKILVLCDSLDRGSELADQLGVPFVSGETTDRMEKFREHRVVIGSRVADEGLSLDELDVVLEHDFHGGSRRQEAQRYGRVMHGDDGEGTHIIQMTDAEYDRYSSRLMALEEQGINIVPQRRE